MILAAALALGVSPAWAYPSLPGAVLSLGAGRTVTARLTYDPSRAKEGGAILVLPGFNDSDAAAARLAEALVLGSGGVLSPGAAFARSHRIPAVAPESARWVGGVLEAQAPVLGRAQREGGVSFQVAEDTVLVRLQEGDVATVDPVRGTVAVSAPEDAQADLASAEALRAYDGLRDAQALLHWWEARQESEPRAGALLVAQLAGRVADGGARADDLKEVSRAVAAALPAAQRQRLTEEERRVLGEAASGTERSLRDELASVREAATALAVDRILARAQPRWDGLKSLAELLGQKAELRGCAALWSELGRAAEQRRAQLKAGPAGDGLAATAAAAGASVPPRAVLGPEFFRRFFGEGRLEARVAELSGDASMGLRRKSARIRELILGRRIAASSELGRDLLGRLPQAETYSVSGAYEDFPQVPRAEVLGKVVEAWAAGFDPGPLGERKRAAQGGLVAEPDSAVTVSAAVQAEVSGTVFSRDPASGRRERIVVSAAKPGPEAAQEYTLDRKSGREVRPALAGASDRLLQAEDLAVLARAARSLDDGEGRGVELEFCRATGRLYLLGSRGIPGLGEEPARAAPFTVAAPASDLTLPIQRLR
ncbi:MAG: PEP-utilizing enzyme [Elusimicrobia bacterium]|nr:PEP-utilizing enzyme [Elusimicrobiota bacterium]